VVPLLRDERSSDWETGSSIRPVVLFLHGYGSNEHDLAGLGSALGLTQPWASLRAPLAVGNGGAAWFTISTPGDPEAGPVLDATDAIWAWVEKNIAPEARIIPIGFSQGGLMATQLLRTRPERVRATVVLGGFVLGAPQVADERLAAERPPVLWGRGAEDTVITASAVARTASWLPAHSALVQRVYPGLAHGIDAAELADVDAFLATNSHSHPMSEPRDVEIGIFTFGELTRAADGASIPADGD
jgi:phospholipase/carboxylesterase